MRLLLSRRLSPTLANLIHRLLQTKPWTLNSSVSATTKSSSTTTTSSRGVRKTVFVSNSQCIFDNLALEEWLYEYADLAGSDYLLMWRNGPTVVVGRHQNPWTECDVQGALQKGIALARRNSGGGTVYHDEGNLNLSFLRHRSRYDRRRNLSLVVEALTSRWDLDLDLNCRDDIVLDGVYKVSGTASKLGRDRTYHHFTLVFDVDKDILSSILHSPLVGVDTKATRSIPSPVKNLTEDAPDLTFDTLVKVIGRRFLRDSHAKELATVDPTDEDWFPGVTLIRHRLGSWQWIWGKTPPFTITRTFAKTIQDSSGPYRHFTLRLAVVVEKGKLHDLSLALSARSRQGDTDVPLPFRLLEVAEVAGERLEWAAMSRLWARCWGRVKEEEGQEDYDLLRWGLECVMKCVPVGWREV